jgi:iron complex outermembrane recepter protein
MRHSLLLGGIASAVIASPARAEEPHPRNLEAVVVTAAPIAVDTRSMAQPASVLSGDELTLALEPTIGETLAGSPGVQSTFFGPAASRPIIRGLGGDRVRVLTDGLATLDASGLSEDHAVAIDPALADQVEVIRGPATLLYGSGAAGGLVNVVTNRLHRHAHESPSGLVELRGDSALGERAAAGRFDTGMGSLALHIDGAWRETEDYEIPGFAESRRLRAMEEEEEEEHEEMRGEVENSWSRTTAGGAGASYIGERWQLGFAASLHDTRYGVPVAHHHEEEGEEEEEEEEGGISIDLEQERVDMRAGVPLGAGDGPALEIRGAWTDYQHAELEPSGEIGTLFEADGLDLRASVNLGESEARQATLGVQWQEAELVASGEEAFVPSTTTRTEGLFGFQRVAFDGGSLEYGLRLDRQRISGASPDYDENAINASLGGLRPISDALSLVGQLSWSERHPSATELYADGPHVATQQFEIGDPELDTERGITAELGLRFVAPALGGELRVFASRYHDFIFLAPTGLEEDELPVFQYLQRDSRFEGVEAELDIPLGDDGAFTLALTGEYLRGRLDDGGDLPRMPPLGLGAKLDYDVGKWAATLSVSHHFMQDEIAAQELPTDAYTMLDADVLYRPDWIGAGMVLFLRGSNLLDEDARMHTSPLKDQLPLPGRSLGIGMRMSFGG